MIIKRIDDASLRAKLVYRRIASSGQTCCLLKSVCEGGNA